MKIESATIRTALMLREMRRDNCRAGFDALP
jgi:hypothetical protein